MSTHHSLCSIVSLGPPIQKFWILPCICLFKFFVSSLSYCEVYTLLFILRCIVTCFLLSKTWSVLQDIIKTPTNESYTCTSHLIINGNIVTDKLKVANEFNKYFNNVGQNLSQNLNSNSNNTFKDYLQNNISSKFSFKKVTTKEIENMELMNWAIIGPHCKN